MGTFWVCGHGRVHKREDLLDPLVKTEIFAPFDEQINGLAIRGIHSDPFGQA